MQLNQPCIALFLVNFVRYVKLGLRVRVIVGMCDLVISYYINTVVGAGLETCRMSSSDLNIGYLAPIKYTLHDYIFVYRNNECQIKNLFYILF